MLDFNDEWYFSIIDIVDALTESTNPRRYWSDLKRKLTENEGFSQLYDKIVQLKLVANDGKMRETKVANTETILRILQSIPSPKAEPLNELEISQPQNLLFLKNEGIDAYLTVKCAAGYDGLPQSASVRLNSTHNGKVIAGITLQNGWGGVHGSICDRQMRKDVSTAAAEIAQALASAIENKRQQ